MRVLVVNAGSSSLKVRFLDNDELLASYDELPDPPPDRIDAVGHRVVHGGTRFIEPVLIDEAVLRELRDLTELAPLHQPKSLNGIDAARKLLPDLPHIACFDTAFHARLPAAAATFALPAEWRARYGIRRFGFHGLSHAWAARRAGELAPESRRIVTCHLGAGASLAAIRDGRSADTTMGFTPLDGLVMATRSGSVDPGLLLWLQDREQLAPHELAEILEHRSGLLALAGTADMRDLLARTDPDADLAIEVYLHRLRAGIAAMTAALGGLDALVFTGGVGENAPGIRERAAAGLEYLGVRLNPDRNGATYSDADISEPGASARTLVVTSREDLEIARGVRALLPHAPRPQA
jgi:acetate kinase